MSFESLLGNEQLKTDLSQSIRKGSFSHCYLITGPEGSGKHTLARLLAAAILCKGTDRPCLACEPCRKVQRDTHPDFITVDDLEHKQVSVKVVRQAREDVYILPNESDHKIFLFPRAQDMGIEGQNALLKVLEEPPAYAVFLLLADNPEKLLPTVRSRCRELKLQPLRQEVLCAALAKEFPQRPQQDIRNAALRSGGFLGQAKALLAENSQLPPQTVHFVRGFVQREVLEILEALVPMEKWKRDDLIPVLEGWVQILEEALSALSGLGAISAEASAIAAHRNARDIYRAIQSLRKAVLYARSNVSPGAVCGWLEWELRS